MAKHIPFLRSELTWRIDSPWLWIVATAGALLLENVASLDQFFQTAFYQNSRWILDADFHNRWKMPLYTTPKIGIIISSSIFCLLLIRAWFTQKSIRPLRLQERKLLLLVCSVALIPLGVSMLKVLTRVYGPSDLLPYGGSHPHIGFLERLWTYGSVAGGRNFPAGHASGGFALIAYAYLPKRRLWRNALFAFGIATGWLMGLYQMARGEHFFSHTLTSMFIAMSVVAFLAKLLSISFADNVYRE